MVYTAVYQQQETGHVVHQAFCRMGTVSLSWGHIGWSVAYYLEFRRVQFIFFFV